MWEGIRFDFLLTFKRTQSIPTLTRPLSSHKNCFHNKPIFTINLFQVRSIPSTPCGPRTSPSVCRLACRLTPRKGAGRETENTFEAPCLVYYKYICFLFSVFCYSFTALGFAASFPVSLLLVPSPLPFRSLRFCFCFCFFY